MKIILTAKTIIILLFYLVLVGFAVLAAIFVKDFFSEKAEIALPGKERDIAQNKENQECVFSIEERIVRGNSLDPLIKHGQTIKALFGYYDCNKIKRGDVVLFDFAGNKNFVIKIIKGISGDNFELRKSEGGWNIIINNKIIKNSENKPYLIFGNAYKMLSLYEKDYKGVIPENAYLLLGNQVSGSVDSTRFGLVHKSGIVAKVEI